MLFKTPRSRIARAFYCDVLQGREVWEMPERGASLAFIVEGTRIDVTTRSSDRGPVVLSVADPGAVAERCWDAGFRVRVRDEPTGDTGVSVIDPFGRRIDLVR